MHFAFSTAKVSHGRRRERCLTNVTSDLAYGYLCIREREAEGRLSTVRSQTESELQLSIPFPSFDFLQALSIDYFEDPPNVIHVSLLRLASVISITESATTFAFPQSEPYKQLHNKSNHPHKHLVT